MKRQYFAPLCEEIKVTAISELLAGSAAPVGIYLPVANGGDIIANWFHGVGNDTTKKKVVPLQAILRNTVRQTYQSITHEM